MQVLYKRVSGHDNYFISPSGSVFSLKKSIFIKLFMNRYGYLCVGMDKRKHSLHRVLYATFIGPLTNNDTINHIDGNKLNNNLENLETMSSVENAKHYHANNRNHGEKFSKLSRAQAEIILKLSPSKMADRMDLAREFGVSVCTINDIIKRRSWKHI